MEEDCCCWVRAAVGNVTYGHTYVFDPVEDPLIAARINGGPSERRDVVNTEVWIRRGDDPDVGAGWEEFGTAPLPRFPNTEVSRGVALAVEGVVSGVQFGSRNSPTDVSQIGLCSPFNPEVILPGQVMEISAEPGRWEMEAEAACRELAVPEACTVNTFLTDAGVGFQAPEPIGSIDCNTAAILALGMVTTGLVLSVDRGGGARGA